MPMTQITWYGFPFHLVPQMKLSGVIFGMSGSNARNLHKRHLKTNLIQAAPASPCSESWRSYHPSGAHSRGDPSPAALCQCQTASLDMAACCVPHPLTQAHPMLRNNPLLAVRGFIITAPSAQADAKFFHIRINVAFSKTAPADATYFANAQTRCH